MIDYFAVMDLPKRPWLDADKLKERFHRLSAEVHPDKVHNAPPDQKAEAHRCYTLLNSAHQKLRHPRDRLQHLLELQAGGKPHELQDMPGQLMQVFSDIAAVCREADHFLKLRSATNSPLLKVQLFETGEEIRQRVIEQQSRLKSWEDQLLQELIRLDELWCHAENIEPASTLLKELEALYRLFGFHARWTDQLQERSVRLAIS